MPFVGPVASTVGMNTLERAIDVERGKQDPMSAALGTVAEAALGKAGEGAATLLPKAFIPSGAAALRAQPAGIGVPAANVALHAAENVPKQSIIGEGYKASQGAIPWMASAATGLPGYMAGVSPEVAGLVATAGAGIPAIIGMGKALVSNTGKESARRAIDLLTSNPTKAMSILGAGPAEGTLAARAAATALAEGGSESTPWTGRRKPR
jgi:hypothetical protein